MQLLRSGIRATKRDQEKESTLPIHFLKIQQCALYLQNKNEWTICPSHSLISKNFENNTVKRSIT